ESLESDRAADIVEEMDPDAAADLLEKLTEDRSDQILKEMQPEERIEVSQLLEFGVRTAAGRMTTEYVAVPDKGTVNDAIETLKQFEGSREAVATIYLYDFANKITGPVFITANVDNDAGGIATYSVAGAQYGYSLLWMMIPITIALVIVQEMASRMGAVTGKGLSDLIREEFGLRATFVLMVALIATNFFNIVAEFAGIASSLELFGWSKFVVVPVSAFVV